MRAHKQFLQMTVDLFTSVNNHFRDQLPIFFSPAGRAYCFFTARRKCFIAYMTSVVYAVDWRQQKQKDNKLVDSKFCAL